MPGIDKGIDFFIHVYEHDINGVRSNTADGPRHTPTNSTDAGDTSE